MEDEKNIIEKVIDVFNLAGNLSFISSTITTSASILFFTYAYNNPELDIWDNLGDNFLITVFKFLMFLAPLFSWFSFFCRGKVIDVFNTKSFEFVGRIYQKNFMSVSNEIHRIHEVQVESLKMSKQFNSELRDLKNKLADVDTLKNCADDCIDNLREVIEASIKIVDVLKQDNLIHEAYGFIKTGHQDYQQFYNMLKAQKDSVEGVFSNKINSLDKDFLSLQDSIKKCSKEIKFIEDKLKSVIADSETLNRVL